MNAPDRLNSIDAQLLDALEEVWNCLRTDEGARSVVLTGAGRAFSAGGNMDTLLRSHRDAGYCRSLTRQTERLVRQILSCELPTVAAVNGPAVGLGANLAGLCDLVVMGADAYLCDPHVNIGLVAGDGGTLTWPLQTSLLSAKEYLLLGDRISAAECVRLGLANRVVSSSDVMATAMGLAGRLADQPRVAVRDTKRVLNARVFDAVERVLHPALSAQQATFVFGDVAEAIASLTAQAGDVSETGGS